MMSATKSEALDHSPDNAGTFGETRIPLSCRVLLADDHAMILDMLQMLLTPEFTVIGSVGDGAALIEAVCAMQPDIALIDIHMPGMGGIEAARQIHARAPQVKLVFMTMDKGADLAAAAFAAGASGYLLKVFPAVELLHALRVVARGGLYFASPVAGVDATRLRESSTQGNGDGHDPKVGLSQREHEVIQLLVQGLPMKEVARRLGISPRTVAFHKYHGMATLRLKRNSDLVRFAVEHGMLSEEASKRPDTQGLGGAAESTIRPNGII